MLNFKNSRSQADRWRKFVNGLEHQLQNLTRSRVHVHGPRLPPKVGQQALTWLQHGLFQSLPAFLRAPNRRARLFDRVQVIFVPYKYHEHCFYLFCFCEKKGLFFGPLFLLGFEREETGSARGKALQWGARSGRSTTWRRGWSGSRRRWKRSSVWWRAWPLSSSSASSSTTTTTCLSQLRPSTP